MAEEQNNKIEHRLTSLEVKIDNLKLHQDMMRELMLTISGNHLPHLEKRLDATKNWIIGLLVMVIMNLIGLGGGIILLLVQRI